MNARVESAAFVEASGVASSALHTLQRTIFSVMASGNALHPVLVLSGASALRVCEELDEGRLKLAGKTVTQ